MAKGGEEREFKGILWSERMKVKVMDLGKKEKGYIPESPTEEPTII